MASLLSSYDADQQRCDEHGDQGTALGQGDRQRLCDSDSLQQIFEAELKEQENADTSNAQPEGDDIRRRQSAGEFHEHLIRTFGSVKIDAQQVLCLAEANDQRRGAGKSRNDGVAEEVHEKSQTGDPHRHLHEADEQGQK